MKYNYLFLIFFVGCIQQDGFEITNLNGNQINVIGHGGSGFQSFDNPYPANSFTSISRAIDGMNADGVEVDVQLSGDSVVVLYHDQRLESSTDGDGFVFERNIDYLQSCRYRNDFTVNITMNEKIISLNKILEYFHEYNPKPDIYLDIKLYNSNRNYSDNFVRNLVQLINFFDAQPWVKIQSVSLDFLISAKNIDSTLCLFLKAPEKEFTINNILNHNLSGIVSLFNNISQMDV